MSKLGEKTYPINKKRSIIQTIIYSLIAVSVLLLFYYFGEYQEMVSETIFKGIGLVFFLFFAIVASTFAKHLKKGEAGLTLDNKGLTDQTSTISLGLIKWKDISGIETTQRKELIIRVKNPDYYVKQAKNSAVRRLLEQNISLYQTPIIIKWSALLIGQDDLQAECEAYLSRFGK
jgi:hypothetical protein